MVDALPAIHTNPDGKEFPPFWRIHHTVPWVVRGVYP